MFHLRQISLYLLLVCIFPILADANNSSKNTSKQYNERTLKKMLSKRPDDLDLHLRLGVVYLKKKQVDKAIVHLRRTNENPTEESLKWSINAYNIKGDYKEVLRNLKILTTLKPRSPEIKTHIGATYVKLHDYDNAVLGFREALKVYPKHLPALWGLIDVYEKKKNNYEMRLILNDIVKFYPKNVKAISKLCQIDTEENLFKPALNSCQKAIFLDQSNASNHVYLGLAYKYSEKQKAAMKILTKAAKQFPKSEFAQFVVASLSEDISNWEAALKYFKQCTVADKLSKRCFLGRGRVLLEMGDYSKSLKSYVRACNIDKSSYSKILEAVGKLRQKKVYKWSSKFKQAARSCGI